jgi:hypothetical protein
MLLALFDLLAKREQAPHSAMNQRRAGYRASRHCFGKLRRH